MSRRLIISLLLLLTANLRLYGQDSTNPFEKRSDEPSRGDSASTDLRELVAETRALRKAVEKLDEKVQRLFRPTPVRVEEQQQSTAVKQRELIHAGTVSGSEYHVICRESGSIGRLVIGAGSKVDLDERLAVGQRGRGFIKILEGGSLSNLVRADIGEQIGSYGSVVIEGQGSQWKTPMGVEIGSRGHGRLEIVDGGLFSNGARADIGNENGSTGEVRVIGEGSQWTTDWGIEVGPGGSGLLLIADGGQVRNGARFDVGAHETGNGQVFVSGNKSSWTCVGGGTIGQKGTGSITVQRGGTVTANSFDIGPRGSVGGDGTINGHIRNAGTLHTSGFLVLNGNLEQQPSGTLAIYEANDGKRARNVRIEGHASLQGTLDLTNCTRLALSATQFSILTAKKIEGEFRDIRRPTKPENWTWRVKYTATEVIVEVQRTSDEVARQNPLRSALPD